MSNILDKVSVMGTTYDLEDRRVDTKAEVDGYYEDMTVGDAEQLVATVGVTDKVPYNFRTAGGSADIGDREVDTLVGGTVAWNQINSNGDFASKTGYLTERGTISVSNNICSYTVTEVGANVHGNRIEKSISTISGHKYLCSYKYLNTINATPWLRFSTDNISVQGSTTANVWGTVCGLIQSTTTGSQAVWMSLSAMSNSVNDVIQVKEFMIIDLTQMFGSTIADYIYTLETGTPGAGVTWFRNLFPKDYYAYDAGSLQSVQAKSHILRGFNAWDEEIEDGYYDVNNNGAKVSSNIWKRCKNLIPCVPNTNYYFYNNSANTDGFGALLFYDASRNQISYKTFGVKNAVIQTPKDCWFMSFYAKEIWIGDNICINLHWDGERDGEYEPYSEHSYDLDPDLTLRGIPKLDSNNKLYYDGDTYESDGTVTRKYSVVDLGTLNYSRSTSYTNPFFYASISLGIKPSDGISIVCSKYVAISGRPANSFGETATDKTIAIKGSDGSQIYIRDDSYTDAATFKTAMSGVYLVYELATPTTESADPFQNPQICDDFGTEEYVDAGVTASTPTRDVAIPVGHETVYRANLRAKLEMMPNSPDSNGDYVVRHNNGTNTYVALEKELPTLPSEDGTYYLKCVVDGSTKTLSWEEQE